MPSTYSEQRDAEQRSWQRRSAEALERIADALESIVDTPPSPESEDR